LEENSQIKFSGIYAMRLVEWRQSLLHRALCDFLIEEVKSMAG